MKKKTNGKKSAGKSFPRVACLGGGNAMPKAVLTGLKKHKVKISAICAMLDSGGSAGRLRKDYRIVSPGDIRRAFIALANTSPAVENLFNYRFQTGQLKDHNFANLLITALELSTKNNYGQVCEEMRKILNIPHEVLPVTLDDSHLFAVLENGQMLSGETNIDIPKHNGRLRIKKVFLRPRAAAYPQALKAINKADLIIIGPGDLYSSLAQILLVDGVAKAVRKSKAKKAYICNLMTKYGETNDFTVLDFTKDIEKKLGGEVDYVIYNKKKISPQRLAANRRTNPELISPVEFSGVNSKPKKFIGRDVVNSSGGIVHDPDKLVKVILSLL